jgi:alpha-amylase
VNYFENGFNSMINFEFKYDAQKRLWIYILKTRYSKRRVERKYCFELFIFSWWRWSLDAKRTKTIEAGTKLLLSPELLRYFMVMKAPVSSSWRNSRRRHLTFIYELGC